MFSDTHFHFKMMTEERGIDGPQTLSQMAKNNCLFALDIGTDADDLISRQNSVEKSIAQMSNFNLQDKARKFMYFSAGIWPNIDAIKDRNNQIKILEKNVLDSINAKDQDILNRKVIAIGEGGLDHHWNPSGADGRCESDFDTEIYNGEKELFMMQLELAKKYNLPFIVHTRDAFEESINCIKEVGYNNGIIHCYSYGIEQAKAFLDLGWYIAFGGAVTYTKKSKFQEMSELLKFIPQDRFLCETDAPYLAPVPFRGQPNTPVLIDNVYNFISEIKNITSEQLCDIVDINIKNLFTIS